MNKFCVLAAVALLSISATAQQELRLEDITSGVYSPTYIYGVNPMKDGETYTQLSDDGTKIVRRSFRNGETVGTLFDCATARGPVKLERIDGYQMSPDETRILLITNKKAIYRRSYTAVHYIFSVQNNKFEALSDGGAQQVPHFSPDGTMIVFVRDNNLFLVKLLFGNAESQITKDGKFNEVINGIPDWVYEEEFSTNRSFDFSADGKFLAWIRYDESAVPIYSIQEFKGSHPEKKQFDEYPGSFNYKYPVAGAKNSQVSVKTFDIQARVTRTMQVPLDADGYIPRIRFTSDPDRLAIVTLNRRQDQMDVYMGNPGSTVCKLVLRDKAEKYIKEKAYAGMQFYKDRFAYISDRSGYDHIYLYNLNGQLERQVTNGNFDVSTLYGYDAAQGKFYYAAHGDGPLQKAVYSVGKDGRAKKLSEKEGTDDAVFSSSLRYYLNVHSSLNSVPVTTLRDNNGKHLQTLVDNKDLTEKLEGKTGQKEFFTFRTSEGVELNGWMLKPRNFDASRKYPVIMYQYSGPGSQEVTDSWNCGFYPGGVFESYMAQEGFIFVCVDGRGTGGRGSAFEKCTYLNLGELEAKDQVETALYLSTLPYVDKTNIGIWGWSFGGFNTLMAMSEGRPVFKAGVAVAAPTSWKYYDTIYTERYMRIPKENAEGYNRNPIEKATALSGDLLLVHGTADDNVHYRNFVEVSEAYVQAGKAFDQQLYTNRNHGIYGGNTRLHLFQKIAAFFKNKLQSNR